MVRIAIAIYDKKRNYIRDIPVITDTVLNDLLAELGAVWIIYIDDENGKIIKETWYID